MRKDQIYLLNDLAEQIGATSTCNLSKGAKDPIEFMQKRGYLL
jgi:hypothetical protein